MIIPSNCSKPQVLYPPLFLSRNLQRGGGQNLGDSTDSLHINDEVGIMHLPGETFIEYQIQAQENRPDAFIAVAGYGDLGTGYITLERSFAEGGYEPVDAFVSGKSEAIMRAAIASVTTP